MSGNETSSRQTTEMREIPVEEAVGMRLAHDLTQIVPGQFKGRKYKRGHLITEADIPGLLDIGKAHIYTLHIGDNDLHEDDAAGRLAVALQGDGIELSEPHEGKVTLRAQRTGLAVIPPDLVESINRIGDIALATVRHHTLVLEGQPVAATRAIPLVLPKEKVEAAEKLAEAYRLTNDSNAPIQVRPLRRLKVGLLTTGSEVYSGRIEDKFGPVVRAKLEALGSEVVEQRFTPDDRQTIVNHIRYLFDSGYDMILVTGGMSVDPDDRTPGAIREAGAHIVSYGTPMLPGSMLLIGYLDGIPIMGLPGCVMHDPYTSFDVLLPRILAGDTITQEDIVTMGYGGLHGC
jgi:molybdenum cofactor synthesis domain-containing protein